MNRVVRKNRRRNRIRKRRIISLFIIIIFFVNVVYGRYIYNAVKDMYLSSKKFYFTSDILNMNHPTYTYTNWGGTETYALKINLYSFKNESLRLDTNLNYSVYCQTSNSDKIQCTVGSVNGTSRADGVISSQTNIEPVYIYIKPLVSLATNEQVSLTVTAVASGDYEKQISATFNFRIIAEGQSYEIEDSANSNYAILKLINSSEDISHYEIEFDPEELRMDLNDNSYINNNDIDTDEVDGVEYLSQIVVTMDADSIKKIKFYKVNKSINYTYPNGAARCAINVTSTIVN